MKAGKVDLLVILGGNPVYTAPADLNSPTALEKVQTPRPPGLYHDETAELCQWQIPEAHFLETWSDARGHDGTASIVQPLIAPLYNGRSAHEVLAALSDRPERQAVRHRPRVLGAGAKPASADFDREWRALAARRHHCRHGLRAEDGHAVGRDAVAMRRPREAGSGTGDLRSAPIRRSTTAASPTTAGCRNCPSRSPS